MTGSSRGRALVAGALCGGWLAALLLVRVSDPWRYPNDDNGAWFSAVARSHLQAGLGATRGQDFFTSRETGELVPYLHHPPLPGLILAAAFRLTGSETPATARLTFALLHLATFALIAVLAARIWDPARQGRHYLLALAVAAATPMSAFYGKMPNHEVPGLLFFLLGVVAWGGVRGGPVSGRGVVAAGAAWTLAAFSSWHAVLCVAGWLAVQWRAAGRRRAATALGALLAAVAAVVLQLLWAGNWSLLASQATAMRFWFAAGDGAGFGQGLDFLRHAFGIGLGRYGQIPGLMSVAWLVLLGADFARGRRRLEPLERGLVGLGIGSLAYALLFPRAVSQHAYQAFYALPFVALSCAAALERLERLPALAARPRLGRALPAAVIALTFLVGTASTLLLYRKPSSRVVEVVRTMERRYR